MKLKLTDVTEEKLKKLEGGELFLIHRALHAMPLTETVMDAHQLVVQEFKRRGMKHTSPLRKDRVFKLDLEEITPRKLRTVSSRELTNLHRRTHQWYSSAQRSGRSIEAIVHAHDWIVAEMKRRGMKHLTPLEVEKPALMQKRDLVLVPDYVSIVGSAVGGAWEDAHDLDILVRDDADQPKYWRENVWLLIRRLLDPRKTGKKLHLLFNPQGPHDGSYVPIFDLVLREADNEAHLVKAANLRFTLMGVGAMKSPRYKPAGLLIERAGKRVMLDGGKENPPKGDLDAWLVTDAHGELMPEIRKLAEARGVEAMVGVFYADDMTIEPRVVQHTSHDSYGYLITTDGRKVVWAPEFIKFPEWADDADLMFAEAASWDRPIRFAGGVGGHLDVLTVAERAKDHGVKRLVFAHIGRPTIRALDDEKTAPFGEFGRDGDTFLVRSAAMARLARPVQKATVKPYSKYTVQKPSMKYFTDFKDVDELWENWGRKKVEVYGAILESPKVDGLRVIMHGTKGKDPLIYMEDVKEDRSKQMPDLTAVLKKMNLSFIVEGELCARAGGKWIARPDIMSALAGKFKADFYVFLYDLLYFNDMDVHGEAFEDRLAYMRAFKRRTGSDRFVVLPQVKVKTKAELLAGAKRLLRYNEMDIEGIITRVPQMPYVFGATDQCAKTKRWVELKVAVLEAVKVKNGYVYSCGLRVPDGSELAALEELDGKPVFPLGKTFVSETKLADTGDTLNVMVEELLYYKDGTVAWGKPTPMGPDKSRGPYTLAQAIVLCKRFGVLKEMLQKSLADYLQEHKDDSDEWEDEPTEFDKAVPGDEGEESGGEEYWKKGWFDTLPTDGKGRYVYQHHWRGLEKDDEQDETKLSEKELLDTDHSVHGDLRFEGAGGVLFGPTVFLGKTKDNRGLPNGDRLIDKGEDALQVTWKLAQPKAWLNVGVGKPAVVEPGGVGATSKTWAKFFALTKGTYRLGVCREHMFEVFIKDGKLKGRMIIMYAPMGGRRVWLINRPTESESYAESHKLDTVVKELRGKRQKYLVWGDETHGPYFITLAKHGDDIVAVFKENKDADQWVVLDKVVGKGTRKTDDDEEPRVVASCEGETCELYTKFVKAEEEKRYTFGILYKATDEQLKDPEFDAHGEAVTGDLLQEAQWKYVRSNDRNIYLQHGLVTGGMKVIGEWVDIVSWPFETRVTIKLPKGRTKTHVIPADSVFMGVVWNELGWRLVKEGKIRGYSMGGWARRRRFPAN